MCVGGGHVPPATPKHEVYLQKEMHHDTPAKRTGKPVERTKGFIYILLFPKENNISFSIRSILSNLPRTIDQHP